MTNDGTVSKRLSSYDFSNVTSSILNLPPVLSEDQGEAALSKSRYTRVIAGAGAGKTETLARRIACLLLVEGVEPRRVVAFTFTEKAARSMKSRIYHTVEKLAGSGATANLGEMYIGTIHGYAKRILEDHFGYGNYGVLDEGKEVAFLMRHGWNIHSHLYAGNYAESCRIFLRTVNMVWDEMLDEGQVEQRAPPFFRRMKRYEDLLKVHRQLTFGRMIHEAVLNLRSNPDKLGHVRHVIIDEYQDINRAQWELINLVGQNSSVFIVGDPRQSIYQWRGSDEEFFEKFAKDFPKVKTVTLTENRRSAKRIVRNANCFADSFEKRAYEHMEPTRKDDGFIGLASLETPDDEAKWIADQIEDLIKKKSLKFSDIGVLTRSVSTSAGPLIHELKKRKVPYIVGGKVGLFKRDEARALGMIFSWFWEDGFWTDDPYRRDESISGNALLSAALKCWDSAHQHGHPTSAEIKLRRIKGDLNSEKSFYRNFTKIYYDILNALGYEKLDYANTNDATVMANLGRFNVLLTDYEFANRIGGRRPEWAHDLKGLFWFINSYALLAYEEQPSDDIRGVDAVQIMTIHQAKGLEWPIVFLFANVTRRFPPSRMGRPQEWCDVPREMFDAKRYEGGLEDERRLFYVAVTRSKDALVISHFRRISNNISRSMLIDSLDKDALTELSDKQRLPELAIHANSQPDEIQTFTAEEVITFSICPHMYLLRDIWGYQPELRQAIGFGNGLHYCLRRAGELIKNEGYSPIEAAEKAVKEDFHMPFVGGEVLENFRKSAGKMLRRFAEKYGDDLKRIEEVEYRIEYPIKSPTNAATIMGKVDVILRDGGSMEVRDYKTSAKVRTSEEISTQVTLYAAGLKSVGRPVTSGSVAYLKEGDVKTVDVSDPALSNAKGEAGRTIESIMKRQFAPAPGKNCSRCDQAPICRWRSSH
ncbi:MAG: ATP-dependent DNA helicase [Promethearchaeati archaeon SRVP18_Atabeyarchaeia-1]